MKKGFTLIELVVSISIFAFMTALIVARYGAFNQSTFLTNMAYDVALTVRTAQTYGLSVKNVDPNVPSGDTSANYQSAYGVKFTANSTSYTFFADKNMNGQYDVGTDLDINTYTLTNGAKVSKIEVCVSSGCSVPAGVTEYILSFKRPDPNMILYYSTIPAATTSGFSAIKITLISSDGSNTQSVLVRNNGQISVGENP